MTDDPSLTRQLMLIRTLCARRLGATVKELAREMGVTEKTIRRDFARLTRAGFVMVESTGDHGRKTWVLTNDGKLPPLTFTFDEAAALYLARPFLEPLAGTNLWQAAHSALCKVRATLSKSAREYLDEFPKLFHSTTNGFGNYSSKSDIIDELAIAIEDLSTPPRIGPKVSPACRGPTCQPNRPASIGSTAVPPRKTTAASHGRRGWLPPEPR